jgi:hypothetical protein
MVSTGMSLVLLANAMVLTTDEEQVSNHSKFSITRARVAAQTLEMLSIMKISRKRTSARKRADAPLSQRVGFSTMTII